MPNLQELLAKTKKISKLVQKNDNATYNDLAKLLCQLVDANAYIVDCNGAIKGYALIHEYECDIMREEVLTNMQFPEEYVDFIMTARDTIANIPHEDQRCSFVAENKCIFLGKTTTVSPIYSKGERFGTLVTAKYDATFTDEDILVLEYAATILGLQFLHERETIAAEILRKKSMVQIAFSTLSYSEMEAVENILGELDGDEGLLIASKIADRVGITRSVIVNALRKFESAGLIETKSLGMKGTYIRVLNPLLFDELHKKS